MKIRLLSVGFCLLLFAGIIVRRLGVLMGGDEIPVSIGGSRYTLKSTENYGEIYDRNGVSFTNRETIYQLADVPLSGSPSLRVITAAEAKIAESAGQTVFVTYKRTSADVPAAHIVGYVSDNKGMAGIERAYNDFLHEETSDSQISFAVDARGSVLEGLGQYSRKAVPINSGVVLTLDMQIQRIVERAAKDCGLTTGAAVVMDLSGDIIASASFPGFDPTNVERYINSDDVSLLNSAPLFNRAFAPFAVGSIFKLTTAAEALEEGITPEYTYNCRGFIRTGGAVFNCHSWAGHGVINMRDAIILSCNPFFIALNQDISLSRYMNRVREFGFGAETVLAPGMVASGGNLPTDTELTETIERANLSFGQGKLTATPIQVCRFTAAIASGGMLPAPRLVMGTRNKDGVYTEHTVSAPERVISEETAAFLRTAMTDTINISVTTALPQTVSAGGKTSTAQTGIYKSDGTEMVHVWFTGFFPADNPQYAVTVLCEDGISGTLTAAPVFAQIADAISRMQNI
jgi:penicillin-binding protein 2